MLPQEGTPGGTPKPRKLKPASCMIAPPDTYVKLMMIGAMDVGRIWRIIIRAASQPMASEDCTYILDLMAMDRAPDDPGRIDTAGDADDHDDLEHAICR